MRFTQNINKSEITVHDFCDTIPFEYTRGKIIVTVLINKQPKRFVFDAGVPLLISNDLIAANNNPIVGSATVTDAGGKTIEQKIVKVPDLTLGNVSLKNGMAEGFEP